MKAILAIFCIILAGCISPVINTYGPPRPGVFVGVPVVPAEIGVELRPTLQVRRAMRQYSGELDATVRELATQPPQPKVGLRAALRK